MALSKSFQTSENVILGDTWCWPKPKLPSMPAAKPYTETLKRDGWGAVAASLNAKSVGASVVDMEAACVWAVVVSGLALASAEQISALKIATRWRSDILRFLLWCVLRACYGLMKTDAGPWFGFKVFCTALSWLKSLRQFLLDCLHNVLWWFCCVLKQGGQCCQNTSPIIWCFADCLSFHLCSRWGCF